MMKKHLTAPFRRPLPLLMTVFLALSLPAGVCLAQNVRDMTVLGFKLGEDGESVKERILAMNKGHVIFDFIPAVKRPDQPQYTGFEAVILEDGSSRTCFRDNCPYALRVFTLSDGRVWQLDETLTVDKKGKRRPGGQNIIRKIVKEYGKNSQLADDAFSSGWAYDENGDFAPWTRFTEWDSLTPAQQTANSFYFPCNSSTFTWGADEGDPEHEFLVSAPDDGCNYYASAQVWERDGLMYYYHLNLSDWSARRADVARLTQEKPGKEEKGRKKPDEEPRRLYRR
jgi:hypothetical protein